MNKKCNCTSIVNKYIDITKLPVDAWEDGLYTLGLDKDKVLVVLEKPNYSPNEEELDKILEGYSKTGHKHNPTDINLNSSNRFVTDTEKDKWNTASTNATNTKNIVENIKMSGSTTPLFKDGGIIIPTIAGPKGEKGDPGAKGDKGNDGKDGTGVNILGTLSSVSQLPTTGTKGDAYLIGGVLYVYVGSGGDVANDKWQNVGNIKGPKGDKGDTGAKGADGQKGDKGDKGDTGPQGLKGDTGDKGATGPAGKDGFKPYWKTTGSTILVASNGEIDLKGAKGDTGDKGDTGPQGLKGDTGAKGDTGPAGKDGFNPYWKTTESTVLVANNGERDLKGAKGDTGAKGATGAKGDTGIQGHKGEKGDTGAKGADGKNGVNAYTHIKYSASSNGSGMVDTPTASTIYMGVYSGTSSTAPTTASSYKWFKTQGPQGAKGATGATGATGLKGDTGAKGDTGPQGLKGDTGDKGDTGPAGKDGFNPYWKTTGSTILVASNGEIDLKGAKGDKGDTGAKGEKGDKGDAGSDANVTKDNVEIALGYTPLPQSGGMLNDYVEKLVIIGENNSINLDEGNTFSKTISADTTFSIDNTKAGAHSFTLIIEMDTLSALTFPTEVKWQDGEAPDMPEANKTYILTFLTIDNGLTLFGMKGGAF